MQEVTTEDTMVESAAQDGETDEAATAPDESLQSRLASATARYREALLATAPEIPEELVVGESPEEVEASLAGARQMVERVRGRIESQIADERVPSGAPVRGAQEFSGMSSREKIAYALTQRSQGR